MFHKKGKCCRPSNSLKANLLRVFRQMGYRCTYNAPGFLLKYCHCVVCGGKCRKEFILMKTCNNCLTTRCPPTHHHRAGGWSSVKFASDKEQTWFLKRPVSRHWSHSPRSCHYQAMFKNNCSLKILLLDSLVYISASLTAWWNSCFMHGTF